MTREERHKAYERIWGPGWDRERPRSELSSGQKLARILVNQISNLYLDHIQTQRIVDTIKEGGSNGVSDKLR